MSGGESLEPTARVCSYSAGTDTNPIYLFSKAAIESHLPPTPSIDYGSGEWRASSPVNFLQPPHLFSFPASFSRLRTLTFTPFPSSRFLRWILFPWSVQLIIKFEIKDCKCYEISNSFFWDSESYLVWRRRKKKITGFVDRESWFLRQFSEDSSLSTSPMIQWTNRELFFTRSKEDDNCISISLRSRRYSVYCMRWTVDRNANIDRG